jgi:trimeric autotransporter adhesin
MSTINVDIVNPETGYELLANNVRLRRMNDGSGSPSNLFIGVPTQNAASMTANQNTMVGSGNYNTTGNGNTVLGCFTADNLTTGNNNVAIGNVALFNTTTGFRNISIGSSSMQSATTGNQNTCIGNQVATTLTTGSRNTCIGNGAQPSSPTVANEITLGDSLIGTLRCAVTSITSLSDARDKEDVAKLTAGLEFVKELNPVSFVWNDRNEDGKHGVKDFGFIAQDLKATQEKYDMAETLGLVYEENPEKLEASYGKLIPILVKAIQELTAKVEQLEK